MTTHTLFVACLSLMTFGSRLSFSQCSTVPAKPANPTFPACSTLTALAGNGDMSNNTNHGYCSSQTINTSVGNGNSNTKLWVLSGQTLTINGQFQSSGAGSTWGDGATIIVQSGATLNLNGNFNNNGTILVYGTLNFNTSGTGQHQDFGYIYIAPGAVLNAKDFALNGNAKVRNEGTMNTTTFQVQSAPNTAICMNSGGCVMMNSFNGIEYEGFDNNSGAGYVYYNNTTCPTGNKSITTTSTLKVCAKVPVSGGTAGTTSSPCAKFGTANVTYGCVPASNNCAGAIALPITLTFFKPVLTNEGVTAKWGTNSQWDSDYFILEKSKNGIDWEFVGSEPSQNGKYTYKEFAIHDPSPFEGDSYYRLVEVDTKDKRTVYATDFVHNDKMFSGFSVYPNPSNGNLNITITGQFPFYSFEILDIFGKPKLNYVLDAGKNELSTDLRSGIYLARLKVGSEYFIQKIIVR